MVTPEFLVLKQVPEPGPQAGRGALKALLWNRNILDALQALHAEMGDVFRLPLPGFNPVVLVGPEANRFVAVESRQDLRWRSEGDPVTELLRQGVLVTDGEQHDMLRHAMTPSLHKSLLGGYTGKMVSRTDQVLDGWRAGSVPDMLVEMRRVALLILMDALFDVDVSPDLAALWPVILRTLAYISPGPWVIWPGIPRPGYARHLRALDAYLYRIIAGRRAQPGGSADLLGALVHSGMEDGLIRDQLLTMLIAGHDTSTALLAWSLYLLGNNLQVMEAVQAEVDDCLQGADPTVESVHGLDLLDRVVKETLRLYPPIHIGNRRAAVDLEFKGYRIPAGARVVYSIYLTHRQPQWWPEPDRFDPDRFLPEAKSARPAYTYMPFGGGPRNCIGAAFAQVEVKVVLARILQRFHLELAEEDVHAHMGATLEPRPGVRMRVTPRAGK